MVDEPEIEDFGVDLESYEQEEDHSFDSQAIDLEGVEEKTKDEPSWLEKIGDIFVQTGRGALKRFTWPLDVLKLGMVGEGLSDIDDLEAQFLKAGKSFDREKYIKAVHDAAGFIPTQDLLESGFENLTGYSLEPKSEFGKAAKQFTEIASFSPGSLGKKAAAATIGTGTTHGLKQAGVSEGKAELIGDVASLSPLTLEKSAKSIPKAAQNYEKTAQKHSLPLLEYMVRERAPALKGRISQNAEKQLKGQLNLNSAQALNKIVTGEIPVSKLRERGINLDALGEHAYEKTRQIAQQKPSAINTKPIVDNIDQEINRIKALAPSPSDAQKQAIQILEAERDALKVGTPNSEQLINQHMNYNADMKQIYRKPQFSGKENEVRKTYEFLKQELVNTMESQGHADVANAFKAVNKIYHEKSKLAQTENILGKAFDGDSYNPKKLEKILNSRDGEFLKRNLSPKAIQDIEEISKYGSEAQSRIGQFIELNSPQVSNAIGSWGQLAPIVLLPNLKGTLLSAAKPIAKRIQGAILTRPATREVYKLTLKDVAEGNFNLLKRDFAKLEAELSKEYGSVENFVDSMLEIEDFSEE